MTRSTAAFLLAFSLAPAASAVAQTSSWPKVTALAPESKVQVELYSGGQISGRVVEIAADTITVVMRDGRRVVPRSEIKRLKVPSLTKRLLFGAVGVSAGALTPILVRPSCKNEGHAIGGAQALGASLGSLVALIPQSRTVYKGPPR